ncbi:MaoC family dehydratase N-terminal domain-containing protein [Nocardioides sp. LHD-245]|uniref:FAS1-like dehydratase domain-containing protein n=1 Tax=Nocardioides sp. LHD-245 TaxID=3051387 RepID=UPI0027DF106D|nr:MaoC family dehydratase N-terminal domain-containing protein [Nocardioides sp. LHD-245]
MTDRPFPVEALHVLTFARAIDDTSPVYAEPAAASAAGLSAPAAPPTFVMAGAHADPDYPLRPQPGRRWYGSGGAPTGFGPSDVDPAAGVLYAEQHFDYRRPVLVGEVLTPLTREGATWEKEGRRGGRLSFFETITEFRDEAGEVVVTSRLVGVRTERTPEPDDSPEATR